MKVKVGDNVLVIAGKDKGKSGKVLKTLKKDNKVVVEGINIVKKHSKPSNTNDKGGIFDIEAPIHVSNVKVTEVTKPSKKEEKKEVKTVAKKAPAKKTSTKKEASSEKAKASKKASK